MLTLDKIKQALATQASISVSIEEEDMHVRGNAIESGDKEFDRSVEDRILADLENGNPYAWCYVRVTAMWGEFEASDSLGMVSCETREEVDALIADHDMRENATHALAEKILKAYNEIASLASLNSRARWGIEAGRGITLDGNRVATVQRSDNTSPTDADELTRTIVRLLNAQ